LATELNWDPNPDPELITDPDTNLRIIPDPAGSGCTTLVYRFKKSTQCKNDEIEKEQFSQTKPLAVP
jgi:hypothetical protein